jgi:Tol biopolymer transport system component
MSPRIRPPIARAVAFAGVAFLAACSSDTATPPTAPGAPLANVASCTLGLTDAEVRTEIAALIAEIDALEQTGTLTAGQANALRGHLQNALRQLDAGKTCPALTMLEAFRQQVQDFVDTGVLTPQEGSSLTDDVDEVINGRRTLLYFSSDRDGDLEIWTLDVANSQLRNLTNDDAWDGTSDRAWSPDGTRIAFASDRSGTYRIYVMNADGTGVTPVSSGPNDQLPEWSPDGSRIVFQRGGLSDSDLWLVNPDGTGQVPLVAVPGRDSDPEWSRDGTRIVFNSDRAVTSGLDVFVVTVATGVQVPLTSAANTDGFAYWSPDGTRIAFLSWRDNVGGAQVYVMNADGSQQTRLTFDEASGPRGWSPDGSRILFESQRNGQPMQLYVMNADGSGQVNVSNDPAWRVVAGQWSPDGSRIAYNACTPGGAVINPPCSLWLVNPDGGAKVKLLEEVPFPFSTGWKP